MSLGQLTVITLGYLWDVASTTVAYIAILLLPGVLLAFVMHHVSSFVVTRFARIPIFGRVLYIFISGPGVLFHELSHALMGLLFLHRIVRIRLNLLSRDGTMGKTELEYPRGSLYGALGGFFVGLAPVILGSLAIYGASRYYVGDEVFNSVSVGIVDFDRFSSFAALGGLLKSVLESMLSVGRSLLARENLGHPGFLTFLYIALSIGSTTTVSPADFRSALRGFWVIAILVFLFNLSTMWVADRFADPAVVFLGQACGSFYAIMVFALIMNLILAVLLSPLTILH
jgi:hypothetical protein